LVLLLLTLAPPAYAGPFAEVGDRQLRQDVALLHAAGLIPGPVDSWPLPWAQIDAWLDRAGDGRDLDPYLKAAVNRLDRLSDLAAQRSALDVRIGGTNNVSVARDFGTLARGQFDGSGRVEFNGETISIALGAGLRSGDGSTADNSYYHFEPSQIAIRLGNWALYGGYTEQWFGPGHDGALLWSNSARPIPKIGLKRLNPDPIDLPVLRWLGPTKFEIFGGVLDEARDFRNTIVFGTRLSFSPARGLQIGLNRAQQLCGDGRPCGFKQISRSFIGIGTSDNGIPGDLQSFLQQPGNQLAGVDVSYVQRFGAYTAKFYFEIEGEDFTSTILDQFGRQVGVTLAGPWGSKGAAFTATAEYTDTYAASLFNGTPLQKLFDSRNLFPGSLYSSGIYTDGYTYRGQPIGYWTDGDSRNLSFLVALTDTRNRRWYGSVRSVHLNITNIGNPPLIIFGGPVPVPFSYRVSTNSEKFAILTGGVEWPTRFGDVRVEGRFQSDSPNTPGRRVNQGAIEVALRQRF